MERGRTVRDAEQFTNGAGAGAGLAGRAVSSGNRSNCLRGFALEQFVGRGMVADVNLHDAASHNPHAHVHADHP